MLQGLRSEQEQNYFVGTRRFSSSNQFWTMTMRDAEPTEFQRRRPDATRGTVDQQGLAGDDPCRALQHLESRRVVQHEADGRDGIDTVRHPDQVISRQTHDFSVAAEDLSVVGEGGDAIAATDAGDSWSNSLDFPTTSQPGVNGHSGPPRYVPSRMRTSGKPTPAASTRTRASPSTGSDSAASTSSRTSGPPRRVATTRRYVVFASATLPGAVAGERASVITTHAPQKTGRLGPFLVARARRLSRPGNASEHA